MRIRTGGESTQRSGNADLDVSRRPGAADLGVAGSKKDVSVGRNRMGRDRARARTARQPRPVVVEALEERLLLSGDLPVITSYLADNRGLIELGVSADLMASTVNSQSVRVFTAGADGLLGTADDKFVSSNVSYDATNNVIRADADVPVDERYRVDVNGDQIVGTNGMKLDAEFNGSGKNSGNGVEGGTLEFFTRSGATTIVRFTTIAGTIDVEMFLQDTPFTVQNFFDYMNTGVWDSTFFHRSASLQDGTPFVVQGGGFTANSSFSAIPQNPAVRNEPGISNIRGTIAMAKLGSNPNSATNQWFFNLGNNAANLDSQNGGFTVFGKITDAAGLAVMDALADYGTVNASAQNGAFTDIPVKDVSVVEDRNGIVVPTDLIRISRIARLYDISAEAFSQLPTQGLQQLLSPNGGAQVTIFSLNGVSLGNLNEFLKVNFSGDKQISSIQFTGNVPSPIGIQITGASVGSIVDKGGAGENLRFIVSDQSISKISIKGSIVGENLNGVLLSNGVLMPDDIDGDGDGADRAALVLVGGSVRNLSVHGDVRGSIVSPEGILSMNIRGQLLDADMVLGTPTEFASSSLSLGSVRDSSLETMTPLRSLNVGEWRGTGQIQAPSIAKLIVGAGKGVSGDIEVGMTLSGSDGAARTLGSAIVKGVAVRSAWNISGDTGLIRIQNGTGNWNLNVSGNVAGLDAGGVLTSSIDIGGVLTRLKASEWLGGEINAGGLLILQVNGNRDASGDLVADMQIGAPQIIRSWIVGGDIRNSTITLSGEVRNFRVNGMLDGSDIDIGNINSIRLNTLRDTNLQFREDLRSLTAKDWDGGELRGANFGSIVMTGERGGVAGNFLADVTVGRVDVFAVAGDYQGDARFRVIQHFTVDGDVIDSNVEFVQVNANNPAVGTVMVGGMLSNSDLRIEGSSNVVSVGAMFDSQIIAGTFQMPPFGFPTSDSGFNNFFLTDSVNVRGLGAGQVSMSNSYILGARLSSVRVVNPDLGTSSTPFGIGALELGRVELIFTDGTAMGLASPTEATAISSFQIRPGFIAPIV